MPAAHTLSVVSGASNPQNPGAIGITDIGNNGYSFIDKSGPPRIRTSSPRPSAITWPTNSCTPSAWPIIPRPTAPMWMPLRPSFPICSDPSTGFSPAAASLLSTLNFQATGQSITAGNGSQMIDGNQVLVPEVSPVPEPSTIALWTLAGFLVVAHRRRKSA